MSMAGLPDLNISLERHLQESLRPLPPIAPDELAETLTGYLSDPPPLTIPYSVLKLVSQWSCTTSGRAALLSHDPPLNPQLYAMITLLAGTTTSPERKLGVYIPPKEPEEVAADRMNDKKIITAILNALLSIGGSAVATWWAAERTGWKNEWRVLFALFVAVVVTVSETALYVIWQSRRSASNLSGTRRRRISARNKKDDMEPTVPESVSSPMAQAIKGTEGLRRRQ